MHKYQDFAVIFTKNGTIIYMYLFFTQVVQDHCQKIQTDKNVLNHLVLQYLVSISSDIFDALCTLNRDFYQCPYYIGDILLPDSFIGPEHFSR